MFESRISAGGVEKIPFPQHLRISSWSYDMAGHAKKCVERYCELANSIVMWEILLNNADWDCSKILTSREILKIQNPLRGNIMRFW